MTPKSIARSLVRMAKRPFRRRPRIIMTLLCRDEEDIIGYNIAYHLAQGVDFVIVTDNASRDRTPRLLERFVQRGQLHLLRQPELTHQQGKWVTRMARKAAVKFDADWVINNDADESWLAEQGTMRNALEAVPRGTDCLEVPRVDMLPPHGTAERFYESMTVHLGSGRAVHGNQAPKICHRAYPDIRVAQGNHFVLRGGVRLAEERDHALRIVHYPLRSPAQLERRIRRGMMALEPNSSMNQSSARRWRNLYGSPLQPARRRPTMRNVR